MCFDGKKPQDQWWNAATLNEQLFVTGQQEVFDAARKERDIKTMSLCMRKCGWNTESISDQMLYWGVTEEEIAQNVPVSEELARTIHEQLKAQILADPDAGVCILTPEIPYPWVDHKHYENGVISRRNMLLWQMPLKLRFAVRSWFRKCHKGWTNQDDRDSSGRQLVAKMDAYCPWRLIYSLDLKPEDLTLVGATPDSRQ